MTTTTQKRAYGWQPDRPDHRDVPLRLTRADKLPASVDLRDTGHLPPVMDQGQLGSCTAHGITAAVRYARRAQGLRDRALSRLQLYYDERALEGAVKSDAGAAIRDGIKSVAKVGVGDEKLWPYDVAKFAARPPKAVYSSAAAYQALRYARVPVSVAGLKSALAQGFPVVVGISVYEQFESAAAAKTGQIDMPEGGPIGGHCMLAVGYGEDGTFTVQNSWGKSWGDRGFCRVPAEYLGSAQFGGDYWSVTQVG